MENSIIFIFFLLPAFYSLNQGQTEWVNYTFGDRVYDIEDNGDDLWIATNGGLVKFNKNTENRTFYNRANIGLPSNHIMSLVIDSLDRVWMGTRHLGLGVLEENTCTVYNTQNAAIPFDQWNTSIAIDNDNNAWIGSLRFLYKFNGLTGIKTQIIIS